MKKRYLLSIVMLAVLVCFGHGEYKNNKDLLFSAVDIAADTVLTRADADFTSDGVPVNDLDGFCLITIFTRAAGSATLTLDVYLEVSYDGGDTVAIYHCHP